MSSPLVPLLLQESSHPILFLYFCKSHPYTFKVFFVKTFLVYFKKIKDYGDDYHNETGRKRRKEWKFFEKMDEILGTKPATQPEVLIDTLASGDHNDTTDDLEGADESEESEDVVGIIL